MYSQEGRSTGHHYMEVLDSASIQYLQVRQLSISSLPCRGCWIQHESSIYRSTLQRVCWKAAISSSKSP